MHRSDAERRVDLAALEKLGHDVRHHHLVGHSYSFRRTALPPVCREFNPAASGLSMASSPDHSQKQADHETADVRLPGDRPAAAEHFAETERTEDEVEAHDDDDEGERISTPL